MAAQPSMTLLYSGLEPGAAGEVVQALEQRGVVHEVRGRAIYVESGQRDELRMTLASEGLPQNNSKGYELLDTLSGFGTTAQMFDAAYWRAKEGELARTNRVVPFNRCCARAHRQCRLESLPEKRETKCVSFGHFNGWNAKRQSCESIAVSCRVRCGWPGSRECIGD